MVDLAHVDTGSDGRPAGDGGVVSVPTTATPLCGNDGEDDTRDLPLVEGRSYLRD